MNQRVKDILDQIARTSTADAAAEADRLCDGDASLLEEVLKHLSKDHATLDLGNIEAATIETVMESSSGAAASEMAEIGTGKRSGTGRGTTSRFKRPEKIGHFRIEGEIPLGRGGFGEVWEGIRVDGGFRQRVAIKIISRAVPDEKVIRRFELERQVLASLDYPDIARLIDGGELEDGRPWLAMEYVDGSSLTTYCDRERLSIDARLRLFMRVAMAVQHAHENLVVHRDIKPDNVMVTADGNPKLLDFGIAKLVNPDLSGGSRVTQVGEGVLTPDYAAPEQFTGESIGTRADVYSLGVLLYELLTSRLPFHDEERGYVNIRTAKLEKEPPRPSDAVSTASVDPETASRISNSRDTGLDRIRRRLDGDLDVIILKALRREPSRRYASPQELVSDLQRHLDGLPVEARPDSLAYRTTRFVARHRAGFAVIAASLFAATFGAVAIATTATARAAHSQAETATARADAESARAEVAEIAREALADLEVTGAALGIEHVIETLSAANELDAADRMSKTLLNRVEHAMLAAPEDPNLLARAFKVRLMRSRLQWTNRNPSLGNRPRAEELRDGLERELRVAIERHPTHPELHFVAMQLFRDKALALPSRDREPYLVEAMGHLEMTERNSGSGLDRNRAMIQTDLGDAHAKNDRLTEAMNAYRSSYDAHRRRDGGAERDLAIIESRLASMHERLGDAEEARRFYERSLNRRERLADQSARPDSARTRRDLANGHWQLANLLASSSPAIARRHLEEYFDLTFEVAWLDPIDHRGAVLDLMNAMSRASRLIKLDGGQLDGFTETIARFRDSIIEPRLATLPDSETRRLAIRADRYLSEVDLSLAFQAELQEDEELAATHRLAAMNRLDSTVLIARAALEIVTDDGDFTAEVGLCLAYLAKSLPDGDSRRGTLVQEARALLRLANEQTPRGSSLKSKLTKEIEAAST